MKKLFYSIMLVCTFSMTMFAQDNDTPVYGYDKDFTIEPFIAFSSSGFVLEGDFIPVESVYNFAAGILIDYHFNPRWSIRSGIIYDRMGDGSFLFTDINGAPISRGYNRTYVSIPIMANWHFGKRKRWNLGFGLTTSFGSENDFFSSIGANDDLEKFLSSALEIGYSFPVGPGFMHISSNGINSFSKTLNFLTQSRSLTSLGYILRI